MGPPIFPELGPFVLRDHQSLGLFRGDFEGRPCPDHFSMLMVTANKTFFKLEEVNPEQQKTAKETFTEKLNFILILD